MSGRAETAVTRLWRDRAQLREQERDEAQARARIAEQNVASLTAENDRLATENARFSGQNDCLAAEIARLSDQNDQLAAEIARLRAQRAAETSRPRTETEQQMEELRTALLSAVGSIDREQPSLTSRPVQRGML